MGAFCPFTDQEWLWPDGKWKIRPAFFSRSRGNLPRFPLLHASGFFCSAKKFRHFGCKTGKNVLKPEVTRHFRFEKYGVQHNEKNVFTVSLYMITNTRGQHGNWWWKLRKWASESINVAGFSDFSNFLAVFWQFFNMSYMFFLAKSLFFFKEDNLYWC